MTQKLPQRHSVIGVVETDSGSTGLDPGITGGGELRSQEKTTYPHATANTSFTSAGNCDSRQDAPVSVVANTCPQRDTQHTVAASRGCTADDIMVALAVKP